MLTFGFCLTHAKCGGPSKRGRAVVHPGFPLTALCSAIGVPSRSRMTTSTVIVVQVVTAMHKGRGYSESSRVVGVD